MLKIRRPLGRLIFNMGIAIPGKTVFLIETAPSIQFGCAITSNALNYSIWRKGCKKGCSLCIDSVRNNIRFYGTQRKMMHKNAHVQVVDFCECKQIIQKNVIQYCQHFNCWQYWIAFLWHLSIHLSISCTWDPHKNIFTFLIFMPYFKILFKIHYNDVIMSTIASQIASLTIVYSMAY